MKIPWSKPSISIEDSMCVANSVKSTWISGGLEQQEFTNKLSNYLKVRNISLTSNGTSALQLAFLLIDVEPGEEIVFPGYGFMAAANLAKQMRVKPIFADVDKESWCVSANNIERVITKNTKSVVVTHSYGNCDNIDELMDLFRGLSRILIIEDSAEALGSSYKGKSLGTFGDFGTYSFHATKLITTGEGGAITWANAENSERVKLLISHGLDRKKHYLHQLAGNNFRMSNINASLGLSQLERIDFHVERRKELDKIYRDLLKEEYKREQISFQKLDSNEIVPWSFPLKLKTKSRSELEIIISRFDEFGIEIRPGFASPEHLRYFEIQNSSQFPISSDLSNSVISLPSYPGMSDEDVFYVVDVLKKIIPT